MSNVTSLNTSESEFYNIFGFVKKDIENLIINNLPLYYTYPNSYAKAADDYFYKVYELIGKLELFIYSNDKTSRDIFMYQSTELVDEMIKLKRQVLSEREKYLKDNGFSDEEIANITSNNTLKVLAYE